MVNEAVLIRMADRVNSYVNKYVDLVAVEKKEEVLELFDKLQQLFPYWTIMTCPIMHPDINYISKNYQNVFGQVNGDMINKRLETFFACVHDADQEDLYSCFSFLHDYLEAIPPEYHYQYRSVLHYRFKKQNGQYLYIHDEKTVLNLRGAGNLYYALFRDITAEKSFSGVKIEVFKQEQSLVKITEYKPSAERNPLTKREGELVTLIKQGLSTKEIAWYLKISHNTVRNIKSKLFEKFNVNNMIELLNMTA
jgi:DNA-binding CsgD family transcriptional regulator